MKFSIPSIIASKVSPFSPSSIPGLLVWTKADQITGLSNDDLVETWEDISGNGNDFIQPTEAIRPIYKTNLQNGKPGLLCNSRTMYIDNASVIGGNTGLTIFVAWKNIGSAGRYILLKWLHPDFVMGFSVDSYPNNTNIVFSVNNPPDVVGSVSKSTDGNSGEGITNIVSVIYNGSGSSVRLFENGSELSVDTTGTIPSSLATTSSKLKLSHEVAPLNANMYEILIYDGVLSDSNHSKVVDYLNSEWAIY